MRDEDPPIESLFRKDRPEPLRCFNDKSFAVGASYAKGGVPYCSKCWKKELEKRRKLETVQTSKRGKIGGQRGVFLPKSIVEMYESAIVDEGLVSVREDIATCEARIRQLTQQIKDDPRNSPNWAVVLDKNLAQMNTAISRGTMTHRQAFESVCEFMKSPIKEKLIWVEVYEVTELKRKSVQTESKRLNDLGWSPDTVMAMIAEVADIIKPLLPELGVRTFMDKLAASRLFNNQQFSLLDQVNLTQKTVEEKLLEQEIHETIKDKKGVYVAKT